MPETPACIASFGTGRISALPRVCFVLGFLLLTVSFGKYDWLGCSLFAAAPFVLSSIAGVSPGSLIRKAAPALPFAACAGAANLFFDRTEIAVFTGISLPAGIISFWVLMAKTIAATVMVLLLAAVSSISGICGALAKLRVPCILTLQISLLFRYLELTAKEAGNITNAYFLRSPSSRIIPVYDWGKLCGRLFLRSLSRANAVYHAMQCRLFHAGAPLETCETGSKCEWFKYISLFTFFALLRGVTA